MYRTYQIRIKPGHRLYAYLEDSCHNAKNLYNTTNFYIRQLFTALKQEEPLQPLQQQALDTLDIYLDVMNTCLRKKNRNVPFTLPTKEKPFISYRFLDALFKVMKQTDYRSLPAQSSQAVMKAVFQAWSSFFTSIREYNKHPQKYTGRPRIPGYTKSNVKEVFFSNQDCMIKAGKFLKLPKTRLRLNIGKLGCTNGKLKQVRVVPNHGHYVIELVFSYPQLQHKTSKSHLMAIDLGINNLATIVTTTGSKPLLVKGKIVKSINQYYNKMKAHYFSILRQGKQPYKGQYTSKRLERLHIKRFCRIKDLFHKTSYHIVKLAVEQDIGKIIIGHNMGWKQGTNMGRRNNQTFCHIPHQRLIEMIIYKAAEKGIKVELTEEAYTSKASFLDNDPVPQLGDKGEWGFSGNRIHRGMYRSIKGLINADVNGAANIMRKVFPNVRASRANGIEGLDDHYVINVSTPLAVSILSKRCSARNSHFI